MDQLERTKQLFMTLKQQGVTHIRLCQVILNEFSKPISYQYVAERVGYVTDCFETDELIPIESPVAAQIIFNCHQPEMILFYELDGVFNNTKTQIS